MIGRQIDSSAPAQPEESWDMVIDSRHSLLDLKLLEVWRYRDLLMMFVKRDFISFYKQTILGPLWFFIQPLLTTIVFTVVFGMIAGIPTEGPKFLFYMGGITAWNYFADCLTKTSSVFRDNSGIFGKVYFPRLILPLSIVASNIIKFGLQLVLFIFSILYFVVVKGADIQITWTILLFPFLILIMALMGLGLGMIISALTTKYRDLSFLITFGVQLLMYATPIIIPLSAAPEEWRLVMELNPMSAVIETFRHGFLGAGTFSFQSLLYSSALTLVFFLGGLIIFNKVEKSFIDTV